MRRLKQPQAVRANAERQVDMAGIVPLSAHIWIAIGAVVDCAGEVKVVEGQPHFWAKVARHGPGRRQRVRLAAAGRDAGRRSGGRHETPGSCQALFVLRLPAGEGWKAGGRGERHRQALSGQATHG